LILNAQKSSITIVKQAIISGRNFLFMLRSSALLVENANADKPRCSAPLSKFVNYM